MGARATREVIYQHEDHAAAEGGSANGRLRLQQSACQGKIQQGRALFALKLEERCQEEVRRG